MVKKMKKAMVGVTLVVGTLAPVSGVTNANAASTGAPSMVKIANDGPQYFYPKEKGGTLKAYCDAHYKPHFWAWDKCMGIVPGTMPV